MIKLILNECLNEMEKMESNYIDSIITDPPYGLKFMNKQWDYEIPTVDTFKEMLRVAKPGAFLLCFGGSRTFHRIACNIEDAGWEIRDTIMWIYGSGFPKSYNISKGIDKYFKEEREIISTKKTKDIKRNVKEDNFNGQPKFGTGAPTKYVGINITKPATIEAEQWDGYGTALKPSFEPIIIAMKQVDKNFVNNALIHGVAGLNIDECRIETNEIKEKDKISKDGNFKGYYKSKDGKYERHYGNGTSNNKGRFPANIIFDEEAGQMLDEQSGILKTHGGGKNGAKFGGVFGNNKSVINSDIFDRKDQGGASRFFKCIEEDEMCRFKYTAKASKKERNMGCENLEEKNRSDLNKMMGQSGKMKTGSGNERTTKFKNNHPTVKPLKLMEYLCKLTKTPKGGIVLDPFMGSGTTGIACLNTDRDFIGIEIDKDYFRIAKSRIKKATENKQLNLFEKRELK